MIRSFWALTRVNPGFAAPDTVQTFRVGIPEADVRDPEQVLRTKEAILRRIQAIPGVTAAGVTTSVPMDDARWSDPIFADDRAYAAGELPAVRRFKFISPEYVGTLRIPLVAGRLFEWSEVYKRIPSPPQIACTST